MSIHFKDNASTWRLIGRVYMKNGGVWHDITEGYYKNQGVWRLIWRKTFFLTLPTAADLNFYDYAISQGAEHGQNIIATLPSTNTIYGTQHLQYALEMGNIDLFGNVTMNVDGYIMGRGGIDGNGKHGSHGLRSNYPFTLNVAGTGGIYGGGGAGGDGGKGADGDDVYYWTEDRFDVSGLIYVWQRRSDPGYVPSPGASDDYGRWGNHAIGYGGWSTSPREYIIDLEAGEEGPNGNPYIYREGDTGQSDGTKRSIRAGEMRNRSTGGNGGQGGDGRGYQQGQTSSLRKGTSGAGGNYGAGSGGQGGSGGNWGTKGNTGGQGGTGYQYVQNSNTTGLTPNTVRANRNAISGSAGVVGGNAGIAMTLPAGMTINNNGDIRGAQDVG